MRRVGGSALGVLVLVMAMAFTAGCGRGTGDGTGAPKPSRSALDPAVLDAWSSFPADAHPRPIVLVGSAVLDPGYATGDAKLAAIDSGYALPAGLPPAPAPSRSVTLPDGPATLPLVDARTAAKLLRPAGAPSPTGKPLPITRVAYGSATFRTDRGDLTLPAWLYTAKDGLGPIAVPAVAASAFWHLEQDHFGGPFDPATVSGDGRTLTVPVPEPLTCTGDTPAVVGVAVESPTAVAVAGFEPVERTGPVDCAAPLVLKFTKVTVHLDAPLGGRVLLDATGNLIAAKPA